MEKEVKQRNQRNRRRERAQRMQAQRESKVKDGDSGEDESPAREKPPRPPARRKTRAREPLGEEDIIDGFAIMAFRTYEDLEAAVKCAASPRTEALSTKPRLLEAPRYYPPTTTTVTSHGLTLLQDAGTSDDSGRASERLTGSSVAPRDPDSSRDRLSDASSRCSSGKGYICDSERDDDDKASPENSRNASPKYHDASMEDASEAGALFRVGGVVSAAAGAGGGAVALSRAPVGGSASPAPAPLPQPAPSPAPAALPPPALPPPARPGGAHIPALDGQPATQIPARAADTPERPAGNKLQPGARAAADSPTPAPPAPPAPSPLFPSHSAHQAHAGALPDYRHTNHETRTEPAEPPPAPLDLHAARAPPKPPPPHALFPRAPVAAPVSAPSCLPAQPLPGRPASPVSAPAAPAACAAPAPAPATAAAAAPPPRPHPYPAPPIGSSHLTSSISSSIHNSHSIPYQSQSSLQKHSVHSVYASRPPHLAPFTVPNHIAPNHIASLTTNQTTATHLSHPINSHSIMNHMSHLPMNHPTSLAASAPAHMGPALPPASTAITVPSFASGLKPHPGLVPAPGPLAAPPAAPADVASAPAVVTSAAGLVSTALPAPDARLAPPPDPAPAANGYPLPAVYAGAAYPPLYAPYATTLQQSPYLPPAAASPRNNTDTRTSLSSSPLVAPRTPKGTRPHTPGSAGAARPHTPPRERESFSSVSSLSRSAPSSNSALVPPVAPLAAPLAAPLGAPLPLAASGLCGLAAPTPTSAAPGALLAHSLAPVPTVPSISSSAKPPAHWGVTRPMGSERGAFAPAPPLFAPPLAPPNPNPFSAESLFQTSPGADLLRRELDNRFLAAAGAAGAGGGAPPPAGARTEMHHHQHQHTHVHQHPPHHPPAPPPPPHVAHPPHHPHQLLMPHAPLFKDVSKMPTLYRSSLGLGYPYSSSLLHPGAPYVPPAPLTSYAPKPVVSAASDPATKPPPRPAVAKTGKWNAMHVRIAWEIYNHQQKEKAGAAGAPPGGGSLGGADKDKLRSFPAPAPPPPYRSPYDLPPAPYLPHHPHLGNLGVSPFARYGAGAFPGSPFGLSAYGRELALSSLHGAHHPPLLHDAWRVRPPPVSVSHAVAADAARREHEERERARRERDERERRDREERERRKQREREMERARARSPLRNGVPEPPKEERKEAPRGVPVGGPLPPYGPAWDPYRAFDPLQHMRFAPLVEAAIRAEEDRHKMLSAYAHHQQLKGPLMHRPLPPHLPPLPHASLAPLPPLAPPLAPLAPLDLLKKEEPR